MRRQAKIGSAMSTLQYEPGVFWRLDEPTIRQLLVLEGWKPEPVTDPPGQVYPIHHHVAPKMIALLHGGMEVHAGSETVRCLSGDKLVIPSGQEHAAVVGPDGCSFFWSDQHR
jgi:mannose-6-phosphate isomerase-like protein (cupin superfamily)